MLILRNRQSSKKILKTVKKTDKVAILKQIKPFTKPVNILLGILYWIWQLTWGALMTIPGLLITGFCIIFLKGKPHRNGYSYIVEIGGNWGGLELGAVALCGSYNTSTSPCYDQWYFEKTRRHEFGHTLQNLIFGPFMPFIVGIPSACRYQYELYRAKKGLFLPDEWYESVWFEGGATAWGEAAITRIEMGKYAY